MKRIILVVLLTVAVVAAGCSSVATPVHLTVADAVGGEAGDFVNLELVRISPLAGGVAYSDGNDQYAFVVYDAVADSDDIMVVVKNADIAFTPEIGDFISIPEGKLVASEGDYPLYVVAGSVLKADSQ